MNPDSIARTIAGMLQLNDIEFKFTGEGRTIDKQGNLVWDWVTVEAVDPTVGQRSGRWYVKLCSVTETAKFLIKVRKFTG